MIINGLRIPHPVVYRKSQVERPRVSIAPTFRVKPTLTERPANPRSIYAMPFLIPIVMAVGSIAAGAAGAAALIGGVITVGTVLAGAMVVGGAMTLIGLATDNKNLVKYGSILSAVGGLGTAAMGLMGGASGAASVTEGAISLGVDSVEAAAGGAVADMSGAVSAGADAAAGGAALDAAGNAAGAVADAAAVSAATPPATPGILESTGTQVSDAAASSPSLNPLASKEAFNVPTGTEGNAFVAQGTEGGGILDWTNKNKDLLKMGVDTVGGYAKGAAAAPLQEAQVGNLNANAEATRQATARAAQKADWGRGISKPLSAYLGK